MEFKISHNYVKEYQNKGFVVIKNLVSKSEAKALEKKTLSFLKKTIKKYKGRDINFASKKRSLNKLHSFHRLHDSSEIVKFSKNNKISTIAKTLIKTKKLELRASEFFAKPKKVGLNTPPHQDNYFWNVKFNKGLTIWIALSKSSKKNGGVYYYCGSHKKGIIKHTPSFAKGTSQKIQDLKKLKRFKKSLPNLDIGDALVHHCLVVHGSYKNLSNYSRRGLTFQFKDKNVQYDNKKIKNYEKQLNFQIQKR